MRGFCVVSGLIHNLEKRTLFRGNVKYVVKKEIMKILPFKVGKLLVRYLGVPLVARKLIVTDCKCLIDKARQWINDRNNMFLSYVGRLQLIAVVVSAMQLYWANVFYYLRVL